MYRIIKKIILILLEIILFFLVGIGLDLAAQSSKQISLKGTIIDNTTNIPLEFATAIVLKSNTIVTGVTANKKGEFTLTVNKGSYIISLVYWL